MHDQTTLNDNESLILDAIHELHGADGPSSTAIPSFFGEEIIGLMAARESAWRNHPDQWSVFNRETANLRMLGLIDYHCRERPMGQTIIRLRDCDELVVDRWLRKGILRTSFDPGGNWGSDDLPPTEVWELHYDVRLGDEVLFSSGYGPVDTESEAKSGFCYGLTPMGLRYLRFPAGSVLLPTPTNDVPNSSGTLKRVHEIVSQFPPEAVEWVTNKQAAAIVGLASRYLANLRADGVKSPDGRYGQDTQGRIWCRFGGPNSHPRYLRQHLKP